jgi:hypothetical protein
MTALPALHGLPLAEKAARIQSFYERTAFHESGIMYSLMAIDGGQVRPFAAADFDGRPAIKSEHWRIKPAGSWELLNNENSITTSGLYLASQCYRYEATRDPAALIEAARAFRSLELIYEFGVADGRPGWMGKPYGFKLSDQTSADQYLDATWGLLLYRPLASPEVQARIAVMQVAFADYWRGIDYTIRYFDHVWDNRTNPHSYNAVFILLNLVAFSLSNDAVYRREAEWFLARGRWREETSLDAWRRQFAAGETVDWPFDRLVADQLQPGEHLCWEKTILCKFVAVAAEWIHRLQPDWLPREQLQATLRRWWELWPYGLGEDFLPYYYYIAGPEPGVWRPAQLTAQLPREEWFFGDPFLSYASQVRWFEPLSRFMATSAILAEHGGPAADEARALARRILEATDEVRIKWMHDPDGQQLRPGLEHYGQTLSSEVPATFLATYWRGRRAGWW